MKHTESGRTLTEVLAFITVVGVITYGALIGISSVIQMWRASATYTDLDTLATGIVDMYAYWVPEWPPHDLTTGTVATIVNNAKKNDLAPAGLDHSKCPLGIMSHSGCMTISKKNPPNGWLKLHLNTDANTVDRLVDLQYHNLVECEATGGGLTCFIEP